jgi:hypothetical protein
VTGFIALLVTISLSGKSVFLVLVFDEAGVCPNIFTIVNTNKSVIKDFFIFKIGL